MLKIQVKDQIMFDFIFSQTIPFRSERRELGWQRGGTGTGFTIPYLFP